jgi:hypothetical protein
MIRSRGLTYAAHCLALVLSCAGCSDDGPNTDSADAGSGGAHAHAGSGGRADGSGGHTAGNGGSLASGGKGASGKGGGGTGGRDDIVCAPCVAPPGPGCVGSGPCGCGPYTCTGDAGAADAGDANDDAGACPTFDDAFVATLKSCKVDTDCKVIQQQIDCCGTYRAMGIAKASATRFSQCAPAASSFPECGCASRPTQADDGRSNANFDLSDVGVRCDGGACRSYVKTRACGTMALTCNDGQLCVGYQTTIGPNTDVEYTCSDNPCSDKLDCECAHGLCDLRSDVQRTCGLDFMADVFCFDPSQ